MTFLVLKLLHELVVFIDGREVLRIARLLGLTIVISHLTVECEQAFVAFWVTTNVAAELVLIERLDNLALVIRIIFLGARHILQIGLLRA